MNGYACRLGARRRVDIARAGVSAIRATVREKESMDMIWSWFSFAVGIGASGVVCIVVGAVLTFWRASLEASE